jgi:TnpA family transposase
VLVPPDSSGRCLERTLFALDGMQNVELRRRGQIGLNKRDAKSALARAVFLNRLGEMRDRSFENPCPHTVRSTALPSPSERCG